MRKWLETLRSNPAMTRRLLMVAVLMGVGAGAFCWGRHAASTQIAVEPGSGDTSGVQPLSVSDSVLTDYQRRPVAYIYDNIPISREELGEYLIARFGTERVGFLVNRKIVELACKSKHIVITDAEVNAQLKQDIESFGKHMTEDLFVNQVLKRFQKTLYEWKEDVIRPKLAMAALVKPRIVVTPADVQDEFEAKYGPRVDCRMIVLQKGCPQVTQIRERIAKSDEAFMEEARKQFIPELATNGGKIPPIHKHFPDAGLEREAFSLKVGEVSSAITVQDGSIVLLRCDSHIPADATKRMEDERAKLILDIEVRKLALGIPQLFEAMSKEARPRIILQGTSSSATPVLSGDPRPMAPVAN
jgi:hypothetical protein